MKNRRVLARLLQAVLACAALALLPGCATDDGPAVTTPTDNVSQLPWARGHSGDAAQQFAGVPQSR